MILIFLRYWLCIPGFYSTYEIILKLGEFEVFLHDQSDQFNSFRAKGCQQKWQDSDDGTSRLVEWRCEDSRLNQGYQSVLCLSRFFRFIFYFTNAQCQNNRTPRHGWISYICGVREGLFFSLKVSSCTVQVPLWCVKTAFVTQGLGNREFVKAMEVYKYISSFCNSNAVSIFPECMPFRFIWPYMLNLCKWSYCHLFLYRWGGDKNIVKPS